MTDIQIRNANVRDCELIVRFLRATLQDMEAVGGHVVNSDETFWRDFTETVSRTIQHNDRLYLLAQTGNVVVGYLDGNSRALHEVFAPREAFISMPSMLSRKQGIKALQPPFFIVLCSGRKRRDAGSRI